MKIRQDISSIGAGNMICVNGLSIHQNMLRVVNEKKKRVESAFLNVQSIQNLPTKLFEGLYVRS